MCGIAGYVGEGNGESLKNMIAAIKYRGPDNTGVFVNGKVGLAHARLSIIDLSPQGNQPMSSGNNSVAIVFNGEIYNFKELREGLNASGKCTFISASDTEVILHLYEEYGEDCFRMLNGMFAIALYDFKEDKLILARDRLGKKPLYWSKFNSTIIFASELKAIAKHPSFKKRLNLQALNKYFLYDYVPTPWSIFENVYKLEPATILTWKEGKVSKRKFWALQGAENKIGLGQAASELGKEIERSTKARLISDVPLGVFLSGGIDSSTIAYYAQKNSVEKIKTFSMGFGEKSFDESRYARRVAEFLNTDHYNFMLREADCLKLIPEVLGDMDEPLADASLIPTLLLSRFTKEHVTVALGGDGGDELFAGYPTFPAHILANFYKRMPRV
ncbi:MAG: asparagine synthase (glutamine-hydrolyzing), partial [Candidatus Colwellbacteria bacterium]|nr:asparagine synthase (glutamine-hydrolyzing) [Candidatus Colwellbacteria bacterium]